MTNNYRSIQNVRYISKQRGKEKSEESACIWPLDLSYAEHYCEAKRIPKIHGSGVQKPSTKCIDSRIG